MALRGPALLGCWDPLRSSHRSSPWRLWAGAEVVLTGGAEVTTRNPQRLWMRAGVLTRAALWPSPASPGLARTSSRLCASALATPRRPPSAALRTAVSKSGREPQSLPGDNQVDVGGMTAKPPSPRWRGHLTSGWGVRSFRTQPDTPWGVGEESRDKLVVVKTEAYGSGRRPDPHEEGSERPTSAQAPSRSWAPSACPPRRHASAHARARTARTRAPGTDCAHASRRPLPGASTSRHLRLSARQALLPLSHQPRIPGAAFFIRSVAHRVCPFVLSWGHDERQAMPP